MRLHLCRALLRYAARICPRARAVSGRVKALLMDLSHTLILTLAARQVCQAEETSRQRKDCVRRSIFGDLSSCQAEHRHLPGRAETLENAGLRWAGGFLILRTLEQARSNAARRCDSAAYGAEKVNRLGICSIVAKCHRVWGAEDIFCVMRHAAFSPAPSECPNSSILMFCFHSVFADLLVATILLLFHDDHSPYTAALIIHTAR